MHCVESLPLKSSMQSPQTTPDHEIRPAFCSSRGGARPTGLSGAEIGTPVDQEQVEGDPGPSVNRATGIEALVEARSGMVQESADFVVAVARSRPLEIVEEIPQCPMSSFS